MTCTVESTYLRLIKEELWLGPRGRWETGTWRKYDGLVAINFEPKEGGRITPASRSWIIDWWRVFFWGWQLKQ